MNEVAEFSLSQLTNSPTPTSVARHAIYLCSRVLIKVLSIQSWVLDTERHAWLKLRIDHSLHTMWDIISQQHVGSSLKSLYGYTSHNTR
ncbi:hypothetical protein DAPPUDRAFT_310508 [Daphnia pulex]|uniref:Uncharacterized protein n=1 Tax=Daphnia pulex TaxID=6669 RepID=E9FTV8_DAPPU|nr:hypothetical protein DAPPUDRAFT_310508 [Daphnia pulex]|eukprot:EFX89574.1 hypothetical protein DAPPUDRAFT_310508 [Daphnia pulex]